MFKAPSQHHSRVMFPSSIESYYPERVEFPPNPSHHDNPYGGIQPNTGSPCKRKPSVMNWSTRSTSDSNTLSSRSISTDECGVRFPQQPSEPMNRRRGNHKNTKNPRIQLHPKPGTSTVHPKTHQGRLKGTPVDCSNGERSLDCDPPVSMAGHNPHTPPGAQQTNAQSQAGNTYQAKFKTELCKNFELQGCCKWGDSCCYAHGYSELRNKTHLNPNYKSKICKHFHGPTGYCPYGLRYALPYTRCQYFHIKDSYKEFLSTLTEYVAIREQELGEIDDLSEVLRSSTKL